MSRGIAGWGGGDSWADPAAAALMFCGPPFTAGRAKALVRTRVEPKTFFANERTFLQWLQIRWGGRGGAIG